MKRKRTPGGKLLEQQWLHFIHRSANGSRDNNHHRDKKKSRREAKASRKFLEALDPGSRAFLLAIPARKAALFCLKVSRISGTSP